MRDNNSTTKRPTSSYSYFGNGIDNEFIFTPQEMELYKDLWLERLNEFSEVDKLAA